MRKEIQSLEIIKQPWFEEYKKRCIESEYLQSLWEPAIGDWMERYYHLDLSIISKEERRIEMICYKSDIGGYWHVMTSDGQSVVWNSQVELAKGTTKWIPRLDQLMLLSLKGDLGQIHMKAFNDLMITIKTIHETAMGGDVKSPTSNL